MTITPEMAGVLAAFTGAMATIAVAWFNSHNADKSLTANEEQEWMDRLAAERERAASERDYYAGQLRTARSELDALRIQVATLWQQVQDLRSELADCLRSNLRMERVQPPEEEE